MDQVTRKNAIKTTPPIRLIAIQKQIHHIHAVAIHAIIMTDTTFLVILLALLGLSQRKTKSKKAICQAVGHNVAVIKLSK